MHPLSLVSALFGRVASVICDMAKPYADRKLAAGGRRAVETYDIASVLDASGNRHCRHASGQPLRLGPQGAHRHPDLGSKGSILFDQERNERVPALSHRRSPRPSRAIRTILVAPHHKPYDAFLPAPGHASASTISRSSSVMNC